LRKKKESAISLQLTEYKKVVLQRAAVDPQEAFHLTDTLALSPEGVEASPDGNANQKYFQKQQSLPRKNRLWIVGTSTIGWQFAKDHFGQSNKSPFHPARG
jgi:hypothetical protein